MAIPIKNTGKHTISVGGLLVPPGETRLIEESLVPSYMRPDKARAEVVQEASDPLAELLGLSVSEIAQAVESLSDADLGRLKETEEVGKARKGVLNAIAAEQLLRAEQAGQDDGQS